jgi:hypothetical protein
MGVEPIARSQEHYQQEKADMKRLEFVLQFSGSAGPADPAKPTGPLKIVGSAESLTMTSTIDNDQVRSDLQFGCGPKATFESVATFLSATSFTEVGKIVFGDGGSDLSFSTAGQGVIGPSAEAGSQSGCVLWKVDSGTGQFEGASGFIASNFIVDGAGKVTDNHLAVIFLK